MVIYYSDDNVDSIMICCKMMAREAFTQSRFIELSWQDGFPILTIDQQQIYYCPFCGAAIIVNRVS